MTSRARSAARSPTTSTMAAAPAERLAASVGKLTPKGGELMGEVFAALRRGQTIITGFVRNDMNTFARTSAASPTTRPPPSVTPTAGTMNWRSGDAST